jgi:oligoendopeptidase F
MYLKIRANVEGHIPGGCFDSMPYVLLNYNYQLNDVSTLAHEMGHSIHSYYSKTNQPYIYSGYATFCAEVASTTNECLLIDYLIKNEKDKKKTIVFNKSTIRRNKNHCI